jgi:uncharacterized protein (TIGR03437 family)
MRARILPVWAALALAAQTVPPPVDPGPHYVASSIVNAAAPVSGALAPGALATIYGTNLSRAERALTDSDIRNGWLPTVLPNTYVRVVVGGLTAPLLYVSPGQLNFQIPSDLGAGETDVTVVLESRAGAKARIRLAESGPALFHMDPEFAIAAHASDGSPVTRQAPAQGGEIIVLYATGLGKTRPPLATGQIATGAATLVKSSDFRVWLDEMELPRGNVLYAGAAPGFAGVYQVNLRLPQSIPDNPAIRISLPEQMSPANLRLITKN